MSAVSQFTQLIKEHGRTLIAAAAAGASQADLNRIAAESIRVRRPAIVQSLAVLNANFAKLSLIDKLSVSVSVGQAYQLVSKLELRAARLSDPGNRLNLDGLINPYK